MGPDDQEGDTVEMATKGSWKLLAPTSEGAGAASSGDPVDTLLAIEDSPKDRAVEPLDEELGHDILLACTN